MISHYYLQRISQQIIWLYSVLLNIFWETTFHFFLFLLLIQTFIGLNTYTLLSVLLYISYFHHRKKERLSGYINQRQLQCENYTCLNYWRLILYALLKHGREILFLIWSENMKITNQLSYYFYKSSSFREFHISILFPTKP